MVQTMSRELFLALVLIIIGFSSSETLTPTSQSIVSSSCSSHYEIIPLKSFHLHGGWTQECQPFYVSYESCLLLLEHASPSCSAAYYVHKVCHLLDQNTLNLQVQPNEAKDLNHDELDGIYLKKINLKNLKNCQEQSKKIPLSTETEIDSNPTPTADQAAASVAATNLNPTILQTTAIESYQQCLHPHYPSSPQYRSPSNFEHLPRLNIVISASLSWKSKNVKEFAHAIAHWRCYAKIHNYNFTLNMIPSKNPADFFVSRWVIVPSLPPLSLYSLSHSLSFLLVLPVTNQFNQLTSPMLNISSTWMRTRSHSMSPDPWSRSFK
jgi:hypothetical protein